MTGEPMGEVLHRPDPEPEPDDRFVPGLEPEPPWFGATLPTIGRPGISVDVGSRSLTSRGAQFARTTLLGLTPIIAWQRGLRRRRTTRMKKISVKPAAAAMLMAIRVPCSMPPPLVGDVVGDDGGGGTARGGGGGGSTKPGQ